MPKQPKPPTHYHQPVNGSRYSPASINPLKRSRIPNMNDDHSQPAPPTAAALDKGASAGEDRRRALLRDLYDRSDQMLAQLFVPGSERKRDVQDEFRNLGNSPRPRVEETEPTPPPKRTVRMINEDDYGDDDDHDEEEDTKEAAQPRIESPTQFRTRGAPKANGVLAFPTPGHLAPSLSLELQRTASSSGQLKTSEEARKQLEAEKKAAEEAAKESSQTVFYTLENDRDAMLEQQKLDELDRQVEAEANGGNNGANGTPKQGTLSSTNLGASSLTLKHLIARIDQRRHLAHATDTQIRILMSDVRKNRSKWASEDKIGQEELYEAAERVLMELKARTEWATPFLQKVNKREAPDYYNVIKHPMDIGTMLKKLKNLQYQSKKEFVDDLDLIWANCLRYNANPEHFLRKKAEHMKKETARLIPLIPDVVIRTRQEVEAEDRRAQTEFDDAEEESDEEPLRTVRGRKAPGKSSMKGSTTARKAPQADEESTPAPDTRALQNTITNLKEEHLRESGLSTPPPRTGTPLGGLGSAAPGSQADFSELELLDVSSVNGTLGQQEDLEQEDEDYKTWKQVTKKDRAQVAAERHLLFKADRINAEAPALLRTKAGMRRWMRLQRSTNDEHALNRSIQDITEMQGAATESTTLAEEIDGVDDCALPDYYDSLAGIPHLDNRLNWKEDADGQVIDPKEECLRMLPEGYFKSSQGLLTSRIEGNMRQMQESRKIVAKIAVVKQMQLQTQTYQNQFQKYEPDPFHEVDIPAHVVSDAGPIMTPWVCRAALQRSVGKLFYHAGFEEFQPSALETMTDIAGKYFADLVRHLTTYTESPQVYTEVQTDIPNIATAAFHAAVAIVPAKVAAPLTTPEIASQSRVLKPRYSKEEAILHMLRESGHDLESLEYYVKDDLERLSSKLETHHARTRDYLAELLRPALDPSLAGQDGAGVFNDGSEQFVGGDFAEDIGEDFFGFKELGLDKEFGFSGFSVPLHLLQSRLATYQPANAAAVPTAGLVMEPPPPYPPLTAETLEEQIGLVKEFFRDKLEKAGKQPIVEDEDLPPKQRFPRPRLPPTGKISSPRKRPIREQQMMARKKRRLEIEAEREREAAANAPANGGLATSANAHDADGAAAPDSTNGAQKEGQQVNGDGGDDDPITAANQDAEGEPDVDIDLEEPEPPNHKLPMTKHISKIKLDASRIDSSSNGSKTGDPSKQQQKNGNSIGGSGGDRGEESGGANGILSPGSVVIAAH